MPSLSQAQTHPRSLPKLSTLSVLGPVGSSLLLPFSMEQRCRAQPYLEATPTQPSLQPKLETATSQLTWGPGTLHQFWQLHSSPSP